MPPAWGLKDSRDQRVRPGPTKKISGGGFMHRNWYRGALLAIAADLVLTFTGYAQHVEVDDAALRAADSDSANWITYGRTYT